MIISKSTNPDNDLYVIGAHIIDILQSTGENSIDYFELHQKLKVNVDVSKYSCSSLDLYLICLPK